MSEGIYTPPPPPPPPPPPAPSASTAGTFDFAKPFTFLFEDPRWLPKIGVGGLFFLLGFVLIGWPFILGYIAKMIRNVVAGEERPLPEWDDLGEYFSEGLRLVGVAFVYILPIIVLAVVMGVPAALMTAAQHEGVRNLGGGMLGCSWCLILPLSLGVTFFLPASLLWATMKRRFGAAFEFGEIWSFIKGNIGNYLLAIVVYLIARFIGGFGVILLCIGVIFTGFWEFLITGHAFAQVYRASGRR